MKDSRALQTALLIGAFVLAYNAYVWSGFYGFTDQYLRKMIIYSIMGSFSVSLIIMGNSNNKTNKEKSIRIVAAMCLGASNLIIILTQKAMLLDPIATITIFNLMTIFAVLLFILKSDKDGNV